MGEPRWWLRLGVRGRLVLVSTALLAVALVVASVLLVLAVRASLTNALDDAGRQRATDIAALVEAGRLPDPLPITGSAVVQVLDAQRRVLASSPGGDRLAPLVGAAAVDSARSGDGVAVDGSRFGSAEPFRVVGVPAGQDDEQTVLVATSAAEIDRSLRVLRLALLAGSPLLLLALALLTWRVSGSALAPVEELRRGAEAISGSQSRADGVRVLPVPASGDEVARLAETLNAMLARLDDASTRQRAFLADAAHELRSPLSSIRVQLEVALARPERQDWPGLASGALADVERLSTLVVDLLELARLDDTPPQRAPLDLLDLVRGAVGDKPGVCIDGAGPVPVTGDATALGRVVTNLVDNASRHAHTAVQVHVGADGDRARLDVRDDGPGVAADDRERIFERFARLDAARARDEGGTGLGLAIVRVVVTQHAGTVTAIARPDGLRGACLRVELPLSPPPGARR